VARFVRCVSIGENIINENNANHCLMVAQFPVENLTTNLTTIDSGGFFLISPLFFDPESSIYALRFSSF